MDSHLRLPEADLDDREHCVLMGFGDQDEYFAGVTCGRNYTIPGIAFRQSIEVGSTHGASTSTFVASLLA